MADHATETAKPQQKPEIIVLDEDWPAGFPTKCSKDERFAFYDSIAEKEHTIIIGGSIKNQGAFTPLLRQFPESMSELIKDEDSWYKSRQAKFKLYVSFCHGIISRNNTTFNKNGAILGPGESEFRINMLYDCWHRNIKKAVTGEDPVLGRALQCSPSGAQPRAMGALKEGATLSQGQLIPQSSLPVQENAMPTARDDSQPRPSLPGHDPSTSVIIRGQQPSLNSRMPMPQQSAQINGFQAPGINNQTQPNNKMRPSSGVPPVPNGMQSGNPPSEMNGQGAQMQDVMASAEVVNRVSYQTSLRASMEPGSGIGSAVPMDGVEFSPSNNPSNGRAGPGQASVPPPIGYQGPTGYRPSPLNSGMQHQDGAYNGIRPGNAQVPSSLLATFNNGPTQLNTQTLEMQSNAVPHLPSQRDGTHTPSMNIHRTASWNAQYSQPMAHANGFAPGPAPPRSGLQTPFQRNTPTCNGLPTQQASKEQEATPEEYKARFAKAVREFSISESEEKHLQRLYNGICNAIEAHDPRTTQEFRDKITAYERRLRPRRDIRRQSSAVNGSEGAAEKERQVPQNNGTPSASIQPSHGANQDQNQGQGQVHHQMPSQVPITPNNSTPTQSAQNRPYSVPLPQTQWEVLYERLKDDCQRRIQENNLDEGDGTSLRHWYGDFLKARKVGAEAQALAAQHAIATFKSRHQRGSKSLKEEVSASTGSRLSTLPVSASGGSQEMNGHSTNVQSMNSQPTNAEPTNGQSTNGQSMESQPTNVQPTNAEPTNAEPTNAEPTNAKPMNAKPMNGQPTNAQSTNTIDQSMNDQGMQQQ